MPEPLRPQDVFSRRASFYATSQTHSDASQLASLVALAAPGADWRALDVGTGTGHTAFAVAPHVSWTIGIDLTTAMLAQAQHLQRERGSAVAWALADAEALPFRDGAFDLVICRRSAHHFRHLGAALDEMARVLRAGGVMVIDDRTVPEDDLVDSLMNQLDMWHDHSHVREYRPSEWASALAAAGLTVERIEGYVQHRPLATFAHGADPEDLAAIRARLAIATAHEQEVLHLVELDGEPAFNNWYVSIRAVK